MNCCSDSFARASCVPQECAVCAERSCDSRMHHCKVSNSSIVACILFACHVFAGLVFAGLVFAGLVFTYSWACVLQVLSGSDMEAL